MSETEQVETRPESVGRVQLEIDAIDTYYFAAAFRSVVRNITIHNIDVPITADDIELSVTIESPLQAPPLQAFRAAIPVFDPREVKTLNGIRMAPNPSVLSRIDEQLPGEVVVTATVAGAIVGSARAPINFLAFNQWMFRPQYFDTLAAFVQPNTSALRPALSRTREILARDTGSDATEGYQLGPDRVREIAKAVFEALQEQKLQYSDPPASFEGYGQKVRTPEVVMEERAATCLDSSVLYASALLAVGIHAYIVLVRGHAFVAYLTDDSFPAELTELVGTLLNQSVTDNKNDIARLHKNEVLQPVETTTIPTKDGTFERSCRVDDRYFTNDLAELSGLVNIEHARMHGIPAIPSQAALSMSLADPSTPLAVEPVEIQIPEPPTGVGAVRGEEGDDERRRIDHDDVPPRVASWLRSLLDLSFNNPLLRIGGASGDKSVLRFPLLPGLIGALEDRLMDRGSFTIFPATDAGGALLQDPGDGKLLGAEMTERGRVYWPDLRAFAADFAHKKKEIAAANPDAAPSRVKQEAEDALTKVYSKELDRTMAGLRRKAREIENRSGANTLFLAIGSVTWTDESVERGRSANRTVRAPLFLIPVRFTGKAKTGYTITTDDTANVSPNYCLLEKLRQSYDITIDDLERPVLDDAGIDVDRLIDKVREALGNANIRDAVVTEDAWLAVLNFSTFRLWKDLRDHWETFQQSPVVAHLISHTHETFVDTEPPDEDVDVALQCPIACDESQLQAVRWAVQGRSFVLEGPPGTGKSQTIANLLAAAIAAGKKVLFVAEKQAALGVVKKRLDAVGLGPFCLDLHDKGSKPDEIRTQIRASLDFTPVDRSAEWEELTAKWTATGGALTDYRDAMHSEGGAGLSTWSAHEERMASGDGPALDVPIEFATSGAEHMNEVRAALLGLPRVAGSAAIVAGGAWSLCDKPEFESIALADLDATVRQLSDARAQCVATFDFVSDALDGPGDLQTLSEIVHLHADGHLLSDAEVDIVRSPDWAKRAETTLGQLDAAAHSVKAVCQTLAPAVLSTDLAPIMGAGTEALAANFLSRKRKTRAFHALLTPLLVAPVDLPVDEAMRLLQAAASSGEQLRSAVQDLITMPGLRLPAAFNPLDPTQIKDVHARISAIPSQAGWLAGALGVRLRQELDGGWQPDPDVVAGLTRAASAWERFYGLLGATSGSMQRWKADRNFSEAWRQSEREWLESAPRFLTLQRWCQVLAALAPLNPVGLGAIRAEILAGNVAPGEAYDQFRRGFLQTAFTERFEAGRFDLFDGREQSRKVEDYVTFDAGRRELSRDQIPGDLVGRRPIKGGRRLGKWGALEQELARKSRKLSIRRLIAEYAEILPDLSPCFLMSPDSVARFIPPGSITFDLVVFDEASQIEVARSVGTIGRAKAVVVVGDTQQMPPSRFGGASAPADDAIDDNLVGTAIQDLESILSECAESNLPRLYLECHYRSRHEELIAFSNHNFYDDRLTTFPTPVEPEQSPIGWRRVDGEFLRNGNREEHRTNPVEARAIVNEIIKRVHDPRHRGDAIAVVTMNVQQQELITRLLEGSEDETVTALLDDESENGLIVRNLESVQGDERDVVILSIAFAPPITRSEDGTVIRGRLPLNFGPLNRRGGERRLNVAVTRARSEVLVFCSFDPAEMELKDTAPRGLTLLKSYLELAKDGAERSADLQMRAPTSPNRHRSEVAAALRDRGFKVRENVGLSTFRIDLTIARPDDDGWLVAVLLDGPGWAARSTVYDRDAMPVTVLQGAMGWPRVERVWLPMWLTNRDEVLDDLAASVEAAAREVETPSASGATDAMAARADSDEGVPSITTGDAAPSTDGHLAPRPDPARTSTAEQEMNRGVDSPNEAPTEPSESVAARAADEPLVPSTPPVQSASEQLIESVRVGPTSEIPIRGPLGTQDVLDRLEDPECRSLVSKAIDECLADFAPISDQQLAKVVASRFGYSRVRSSRAREILALVPRALRRKSKLGNFVWSGDLVPESWTGYRDTDHPVGKRAIDDIAPEEIANAVVDLVCQGVEIDHDELLRATASMFGAKRLTTGIRTRLEAVLALTIDAGRVEQTAVGYRVAGSDGPAAG